MDMIRHLQDTQETGKQESCIARVNGIPKAIFCSSLRTPAQHITSSSAASKIADHKKLLPKTTLGFSLLLQDFGHTIFLRQLVTWSHLKKGGKDTVFSTISGFYDFLMCFSVDKSGACMIVFHYFGGKIPDFLWGLGRTSTQKWCSSQAIFPGIMDCWEYTHICF